MTTGLHAATLESPRLKKVWNALKDHPEGLTTMAIILLTGVCAVSAIISELRKCGIPIECEYIGRTDKGASVFRYKLVTA